MKDKKRKIRQEKMANLLYELGMDEELVSRVSGIKIEKTNKRNNKNSSV